jgi:hypothetical protein
MKNSRDRNRIIVRLFAIIALLSGAINAFGACKVPPYRRGRLWEVKESDVMIGISIRLEDFAPDRLICLAGALRERFPGRSVAAYIFSSHEAALGYVPGSIDLSPAQASYQFKLHGIYVYNKEKRANYLHIAPDGHSHDFDPRLTTRMDLPVTGTPACTLAINGRCLLEFEHIYPPPAEGKPEVSGRVTVGGNIRRDGAVSDLAVVDARVNPGERQSELVSWARKNLSTWRFERGRHKDSLRVTYDFVVVEPPLAENGGGVQFRLPNEVRVETVRAR